MLFFDKKSALVRLSDSLKMGLSQCAQTSTEILNAFLPYEERFREAQTITKEALAQDIEPVTVEQRLNEALSTIPQEVLAQGASLQGQLHSQALSTILMCCFCLESYVNSLAYFIYHESDFLGLIRNGHKTAAEVLIEAIDRMSTRDKWQTIGKLGNASGFDTSRSPFQDFNILFRFRNDHVHDKVVDYNKDRAKKQYNGRFPDPMLGILDLGHALYAAQTYWDMVRVVHQLTGIDINSFHGHYNLSPWLDVGQKEQFESLAKLYVEKLRSRHGAG